MLEEYIKDYCKALKAGDKKTCRQIEGQLCRIGMDRTTLKYLVTEYMKEMQNNG